MLKDDVMVNEIIEVVLNKLLTI